MRILKDGIIYFVASILEKSVPFILLPFLTRVLSTEEYGLISIFTTVAVIYGLVIGLGLNAFVRVVYHKIKSHEFNSYVSNVLILSIISLLVAIIITMLFKTFIIQVSGLGNNFIPLVIVMSSAQFVINLRLVIFQTTRKSLQYGKLQVSRPLVDLFLVVFLVFYLSGGGEERIYSLVISNVVTGIIACMSMYRDNLLVLKFNKIHAARAMQFVLPLLPHSIALTAFFTVDKLILSSSIGLSIVGELAVTLSLASPVWIITESINRSFMPWSFERFRKGELENVVGASYILLIIMFLICIMYSALLFMFFELVVGESFLNTLVPAMILIWVGWLKLAYYLVLKGIVYCEKTVYLALVSISSGITYLGLILVNIDDLDLIDMSLYIIVLHFLMFVGAAIISQVQYPQPWGTFSLTKNVAKLVLVQLLQRKNDTRSVK
ncbi:MAG: oligosaccharide flippase family protein [gamma proteobacterium symbiont of Lucinoma myriamae]|nr:oligosaccharide flippase family protein [gamma proteobacterium symbiont of Lucinoma myriamae]MCU7819400.1 oligosaccharide flippase family protein [gamma proteobacterium symbiont of Lucinoma myriamae]